MQDFSKLENRRERLAEVPFRLRDCVESAVALLAPQAHEKGVELISLVYNDVPDGLVGDAARVGQILTKLLDDAVKFTDRGVVVLRTMLDQEEEESVQLTFSITDTGVGGDVHDAARTSTAFSEGGTSPQRLAGAIGPDLSICRHLAHAMDGSIGVTKGNAGSSVFRATLRLRKGAPRAITGGGQFPGLRVLLHDAHAPSRRALQHLLEAQGCLVVEETGRASLATLEPPPALAVLGIAGAEALDAAADWIAALHAARAIPVLALVSSSDRQVLAQLRERGAADALSKPPTRAQLARALARCVAATDERATTAPPSPAAQASSVQTGSLADALPVRDLERALQAAGGRPEVAVQLLDKLLEELPDTMRTLQEAYAARQWERLWQLQHRLKGASAICALSALQAALSLFEQHSRERDADAAGSALAELRRQAERLAKAQGFAGPHND